MNTNELKPSEILREEDWCKGSYAKNAIGEECSQYSPFAVAFCILGAIYKSFNNNYGPNIDLFSRILVKICEQFYELKKLINDKSFIIGTNEFYISNKKEAIYLLEKAEIIYENTLKGTKFPENKEQVFEMIEGLDYSKIVERMESKIFV
ncbi:MAG: hypothetical protein AABY22_16965 [Nanoarchaeota archaeon]